MVSRHHGDAHPTVQRSGTRADGMPAMLLAVLRHLRTPTIVVSDELSRGHSFGHQGAERFARRKVREAFDPEGHLEECASVHWRIKRSTRVELEVPGAKTNPARRVGRSDLYWTGTA